MKGTFVGRKWLNDGEVETITAFLFHRGGHDDPARLRANDGKSFQGSVVVGMGFTFDDTDNQGAASSIAEMRRLIEEHPRNSEVIFPYIGGDEVNTSPTLAYDLFVINFGELSEAEAGRWPKLLAIVESRVRPEREAALAESWSQDKEKRAKRWWQFSRFAKDLYKAIAGLERVLVVSSVSQHAGFAFLPKRIVFSHALIVFPLPTYGAFCVLQSRPHEIWARFFGSSLEDRLRYTPSDCFETFPFPEGFETNLTLEQVGLEYYKFRAALMVENNEGLTATYNRFHDPEETNPDVLRLRELHAAMDRAVLDAYGWTDIQPGCEFILDYEEEEDEESGPLRRKKPWRYRWPDEIRDEVLARLLELNRKRAEQEQINGLAAEKTVVKGKPRKSRKGKAAEAGQMVAEFLKEKS